jgi:hypothetical protein
MAVNLQSRNPAMNEFLTQLAAIATVVERTVATFARWAEASARNAERAHERGELLAAYRCRSSWKKADVPRLQSLDINAVARRRVLRVTGVGRPMVRFHQPLGTILAGRFAEFQTLCHPTASPEQRKRALEQWPWYRHYVEALYRGELVRAKRTGIAQPSKHAEDVVGAALNKSPASIHKICGVIRALRKEDAGAANFPPMTLDEFNRLLRNGLHERVGRTWDVQ